MMAAFVRPDGYDDSSEDEFDGFVFGDSYNSHEKADHDLSRHKDMDFVPTVASVVKKGQEANNTSSEPAGELIFNT